MITLVDDSATKQSSITIDGRLGRRANMSGWWTKYAVERYGTSVVRWSDTTIVVRHPTPINNVTFVKRWCDYGAINILRGQAQVTAKTLFMDTLHSDYDNLDFMERCLVHWLEFEQRFGFPPTGYPDAFRQRCVSCRLYMFRDRLRDGWRRFQCPRCGHDGLS